LNVGITKPFKGAIKVEYTRWLLRKLALMLVDDTDKTNLVLEAPKLEDSKIGLSMHGETYLLIESLRGFGYAAPRLELVFFATKEKLPRFFLLFPIVNLWPTFRFLLLQFNCR
jgi:hypothetical protein